jgi:hypothetical protein
LGPHLEEVKEAFDSSERRRRFSVSVENGKLRISHSRATVYRAYLLLVSVAAISIGNFLYQFWYFPPEGKRWAALAIAAVVGLTMCLVTVVVVVMVIFTAYVFDHGTDRVLRRRSTICRTSEITEVEVLKQAHRSIGEESYLLRLNLYDGKRLTLFQGKLPRTQFVDLADTIGDYLGIRVVKSS